LFDLPYWSDLDVKHCIDIMRVEKNLFDRVIGMLLNIQGKIKDGLNTHQDLVEMSIRDQLHPRFDGKKIDLPPTCHTLSRKEKIFFVSVCVVLKSHDFHILV